MHRKAWVPFCSALALICLAGKTPAAGGSFYIGASAAANRLNVRYEKVVDNSHPQNFSANLGRKLRDEASATKLAYGYGVLAGYKLPLSVTGIYLGLEGEMLRHGGQATGRLAGTGDATRRSQLGEVWPEDWTFESDTSLGLTGRLGVGLPLIGNWFGPSVYGLFGMRRVTAGFRSEYAGCTTATPCTEPGQFVAGSDSFKENFSGTTVGGGVEQKVGLISIRGELRMTNYSDAGRAISFDELFVSVPVTLQPKAISFGLSVIWYF